MPRILLFDIDLTLIQTSRSGRAAIEAAFERRYGIHEALAGIAIDGRTDHAIFMEAIALHRLDGADPLDLYHELASVYIAELAGMLPTRPGTVLPGVPDLLAALTESHRALGLATGNMRAGAKAKLGHFGLWESFAAGGFGDHTPVRAQVVRDGIEALAAVLAIDPDPRECVVIGDTPLDVQAAHLAGARALAVATGSYLRAQLEASGAEWIVEDLRDTRRLVELLRGG